MLKRFFSALLALALVISLCPQTAFAASTPDQPLVISGQTDVHTNPLYPDVVPDTVPDTGRNTAPTLKAGTSESHYGTLEEIAADIRGYMKSRTETFTVYWNYRPTTSDQNAMKDEVTAAIRQALEMAMEHTGNPTEGDYIRWMWGKWNVEWNASGMSYSNLNVALTFTLTYYTNAQQEQEMDQAVKSLLKELNLNGKSDYQKIQAIYDYITHHVVYDDANLNNKNYTLQYTAYAALINGTSVCQGYATLFYRLALELGIDARLIAGTSSRQSHAWNIVELDNLYYNLDSTWDANVAAEGWDYQYFLKSNGDFPDHARSEEYTTTAFNQAYPMATSSYTPGTTPPQHTHSYTTTVTQPTCTEKGYTTYTCACGDSYTGNEVAAKGHTEVVDKAVAATCTATGLTEGKHCSVCNTVTLKQNTVPAKGHTEVVDKAVAATCTATGLTEGKHCSVCNTVTVKQQTIAAKGHTEVVDKAVAATCTATGLTEGKHCSVCNTVTLKQNTVPAKGHTFSNGKCSVCGEKDPDYVAPTEHTHIYSSKVTAPTCTEKGYTTYTCACGDSYTGNEMTAKGHTEVVDKAVAATCTASGLTEGKHCTVCNTVTLKQNTVPAKGHTFSNGKCSVCGEKDPDYVAPTEHTHNYSSKVTAPTCTEKGYTTYTCACGDSYTGNEVAAKGHTFSDGKCSVCGEKDPDYVAPTEHTHNYSSKVTAPTCTEKGYTTYTCACGDSYTGNEVAAKGHTEVVDNAVAATCTATGLTEGKHCSVCNTVTLKQETIPAKGHTFSDGKCSVCGEKDPTYTEPSKPSYSITVHYDSSMGTVSTDHITAHAGDTVKIQASAFDGCHIAQVYILYTEIMHKDILLSGAAESSYDFSFEMPDENVEITVSFLSAEDQGQYLVEVVPTQGGSAYASVKTANTGDRVLLTVTPSAGYELDMVYVYSYGTNPAECKALNETQFEIIMPDSDVRIEVCFILKDTPFTDVKTSDYFCQPVLWAVSNGITSGISANQFGSNNACTRAQVVTFLWAAAGKPEPESTANPFTDVKKSDYFYKAVLWAVENGITSGMDATTFGSNCPCIRAQVVTFLWAALGRPEPTTTENPFTDVKETDYYYKAVLFAVENGITSGMSATTFGSGNTCTRAHVVTFLYKTFHG